MVHVLSLHHAAALPLPDIHLHENNHGLKFNTNDPRMYFSPVSDAGMKQERARLVKLPSVC